MHSFSIACNNGIKATKVVKKMIKTYKYGFEYKEIRYGWSNKKLHRLPCIKNKRSYQLKELDLIEIGNKKGYRVCGDRKTIDQLKGITEIINYKHVINGKGSKDCPF